jgi:hypothetical protein
MKRGAEEPPGLSKALDGQGKEQMASAAARRVCWNWAKGMCRYGVSCRFSHATSAPSTPQATQQVKQQAELPAQPLPGPIRPVGSHEQKQKRHSSAGATTASVSMLAAPSAQQQPSTGFQRSTATSWRDRVWSHSQVGNVRDMTCMQLASDNNAMSLASGTCLTRFGPAYNAEEHSTRLLPIHFHRFCSCRPSVQHLGAGPSGS